MFTPVALLLLLACAPKTAAPSAPTDAPTAPAATAPETLPTPYTAEQLRAAMPVGTTMRYRLDAAEQPTMEQRWVVTAADEQTCTIASTMHDPQSGELKVDEGAETSAWTELRDHAAFPPGLTTETSEEIDIPAGHFATRVYHVRQPDGPIRHFWFAPELPGPPVQMVVAAPDGTELMKMTLLERSPR